MTRLSSDAFLDKEVSKLRLINASRAQTLAKLSIYNVRNLLEFYPFRYIDLTNIQTAASAQIGQTVTVLGTIQRVKTLQPRRNLNIVEAALVDDSGVILGIWFRQSWIANKVHEGDYVALSGKVSYDYGFKRIVSPYLEVLENNTAKADIGLVPVYHVTQGLSVSWMRRYISIALEQCADIHDSLPSSIRSKHNLSSKKAALRSIHFPSSWQAYSFARKRLAYEEVFFLQLLMLQRKIKETQKSLATQHTKGDKFKALYCALPFSLSDEQQNAIDEITSDMCSNFVMNRMLLGDVGTGKTIVSAFAMALCADSSTQAVVMAPTEVLARQYEKSLGSLFDACNIRYVTLTGSTSVSERANICERLLAGKIDVLFGTHALLEPDVVFKELSLCIIDEQHRFGVQQRSTLREKGKACDLLVMTATPIPRTLALTLYGDLDTSFICKRPATLAQTTTVHISRDERFEAYEAIRAALKRGEQAYIICPLVGLTHEQRADVEFSHELFLDEQSEYDYSNVKAAEDEAQFLSAKVFPEAKIGLLTGRMNSSKKQEVMEEFRAGVIDILVATTVVEVGIDVVNATVMIIEDAERFGLSQLHQLRGRVGRGTLPGQVFVVADPKKDDDNLKQRIDTFVHCDNGFELAQADLKIRHEGNILGLRQHGRSILKLTDVLADEKLIQQAHTDALQVLNEDPSLCKKQNVSLKRELERLRIHFDECSKTK